MSVSAFTTAIRRAAAGSGGVPAQLEPQAAVWWQRAAGRIADWKVGKKNKEGSAQTQVEGRGTSGRRAASLTTRLFGAAVQRAVHQHLTFLGTVDGRRKGTDDGFALNAHSVFITRTVLAAVLPSFPTLFKRGRFRVGQHGNAGSVQSRRRHLFRLPVRTSATFH